MAGGALATSATISDNSNRIVDGIPVGGVGRGETSSGTGPPVMRSDQGINAAHALHLVRDWINENVALGNMASAPQLGNSMISTWSDWKRYPRAGRGENLEAPISPGIYEVRFAATGALHSFGAVDNVAQALALLPAASKSWFGRRGRAATPDLEYRTCATSTKADAKAVAERMIGRRETYLSGAA
jgi:hypothetical protein